MKKKLYIIPLVEVTRVNTALMQAFGEASMPNDQFNGTPRKHWTDVF